MATNVAAQATTFSITDIKRYAQVVTLSTQDNAKPVRHLKSGFKRTISWNGYQPKVPIKKKPNQYLDFLTDPSFQGLNRFFALSFQNEAQRKSYKRYYLPTRETKSYNVMIDEQNFFDQPVRNNLTTYDNIQRNATGQRDDYTTGCLLDYDYLK